MIRKLALAAPATSRYSAPAMPISRRWRAAALALGCVLWSSGAGLLAEGPIPPVPKKQIGVAIPEPTDRGNWDGTWLYVSRQGRLAVWVRTTEGPLQMKFRYEGRLAAETFETGWDGRAEYLAQGRRGLFAVTIEEADANRAKGTWLWELKSTGAKRYERGRFTLYRAGDGRSLVFHFDNYEKKIRKGNREGGFEGEHVIVFRKVSKRHVLWEELP